MRGAEPWKPSDAAPIEPPTTPHEYLVLLGDARLDLGHLHGYQEDDDESGRGAMEIIDGNPLEGCSGGVSTRKYGHNRGAWAENKAVITVRDALLLSPHPPLYGSIITSALLLSILNFLNRSI